MTVEFKFEIVQSSCFFFWPQEKRDKNTHSARGTKCEDL